MIKSMELIIDEFYNKKDMNEHLKRKQLLKEEQTELWLILHIVYNTSHREEQQYLKKIANDTK